MSLSYLGKLDYADPLYEILLFTEFYNIKDPVFHVSKLSHRYVFKYTEEKSQMSVVGKFFQLNDTRQDRILRIKCEYDNLHRIRNYGLDKFPNYVVRPICRENRIGLALVEEFIAGKDLDYFIKKAIYQGDGKSLKKVISGLATFLYALHTKTKSSTSLELDPVATYFQKIVKKLNNQDVISDSDRNGYTRLMDKWLSQPFLQGADKVIVHGDTTPTNFIITKKGNVVAIDLERMKTSDAVFDVGMLAGEIKHAFLWRTGNYYASEPYIRHLLKSYASHFRNEKKVFRQIVLRNPFYMALSELRIARNDYLDWHYRKRLAYEAMECLSWGLKLI